MCWFFLVSYWCCTVLEHICQRSVVELELDSDTTNVLSWKTNAKEMFDLYSLSKEMSAVVDVVWYGVV